LRVKPGFGKPRFLSTGTEGGKSSIGRWARFHIPGVVGSSGASADSSPASTNPLEGLSELSARAAAPRAALAHASGRAKGGQKRTMVRFWGRGAGGRGRATHWRAAHVNWFTRRGWRKRYRHRHARPCAPILSRGSGAHSRDHAVARTGGSDLGAVPHRRPPISLKPWPKARAAQPHAPM
jgi:hypothetical protein